MSDVSADGKIITFYSYKGGTGRSLMLANVAWILASAGRRVLTVDWDLEAPGLHRYFEPFLVADPDLLRSDGVIDLVSDFVTEAAASHETDDGREESWHKSLADVRRCAVALERDFADGGALHFVPSGRQGASYPTRVNAFSWQQFYDRCNGGAFLEEVKTSMRQYYDYTLIDSRTGVSDTSGICTVQMPDTLVMCFTLNNQGIEGTAAVAQSVLAQKADRPILPVPMRLENNEKDKLELRKEYARRRFAGFPANQGVADSYWADVEVPYVPFYAYEEIIAAFSDRIDDRYSVLGAAQRIAGYVWDEPSVPQLKPIDEDERIRVRDAYERRAREGAASRRIDVFLSYSKPDATITERIAVELRKAGLRPWLDRWELRPGDARSEHVTAALETASALAVLIGPDDVGVSTRPELEAAAEPAASDKLRAFPVLLPGVPDGFVATWLPPFLADRAGVDLRTGADDPGWAAPLIEAVRGRPLSTPVERDVSPYVGLRPFDEADAQFFRGREAEVARLVEQLSGTRFLALIGASGVGKTSLVRAGLVTQLRADPSWRVALVRPGSDPVRALAAEMARLAGDGGVERWTRALIERPDAVQTASKQALVDGAGRVLWIVDQAEELFAPELGTEAREIFLRTVLNAAAEPSGAATVLLVMRADVYVAIAKHPELGERVAHSQFLLAPLDRDRLLETILQPARQGGLTLEPGLAETMVADVASEPGALPLLQFTLRAIWERRQGDVLTLADYRDAGGIAGSVAKRADAVYAGLGPAQQRIARRVFLRLVQPSSAGPDTRRRARMGELVTSRDEQDEITAVVETLVNANLLVASVDAARDLWVEVAHEALIRAWPRLRGWLAEQRSTLSFQRRVTAAAAEWALSDEDASFLYRGAVLASAEMLLSDDVEPLNPLERRFLEKSAEHERRTARRRRLMLAVWAVWTAALAVAFLLGYLS